MELNLIKNRFSFYAISGIVSILSILVLLFGSKNLGIDMTGGIQMEYEFGKNINIEQIRETINSEISEKSYLSGTEIYNISGTNNVVVIAGFSETASEEILEQEKIEFRGETLNLMKNLDNSVTEKTYTNIGKTFGDYIRNTAILTLAISIIGIAIYITWSFSVGNAKTMFSFSFVTITTLTHNIIIASGIYIILGFLFKDLKIDTFFVTGLLTIIGYSINDIIVILDRIRANLKKYVPLGKELSEIIETSVNESFARSIYTSLTLVFILLTTYIWGPNSISGFVLLVMIGTIVGTYSSIFIGSTILYDLNKKSTLEMASSGSREISPEEKTMV